MMIIEGLITCADDQGRPHVAALGPVVNPELTQWTLRPFQSSRIFTCLRSNPQCVFHVVDDALPIIRLVLGHLPEVSLRSDSGVWIIEEACHWYHLRVTEWELDHQRSQARADLIGHGYLRPFWGWNRAKHALIEAAILISRAGILPAEDVEEQLSRLESPIVKTAGPRETAAWALIQQWRAQQSQQS